MLLPLLLSLQGTAPSAEAPSLPCIADEAALLALSPEQFDQDMNGGWRIVYARPECRSDAADLIAVYRRINLQWQRSMAWHEGQVRAELGQTAEAIALMEQARRPAEEHGYSNAQWNAYVDATQAFLRRDSVALTAARDLLARSPNLPNRTGPAMNLSVVDALIRCFDQPYAQAYGSSGCRQAD